VAVAWVGVAAGGAYRVAGGGPAMGVG